LSHQGGKWKRRFISRTWGKIAHDHPEIDLVYLIGRPELKQPLREGNHLYLPCQDGYMQLPQKTRWFCLWALGYTTIPWLFKSDDDTYIRPERLVEYCKQKSYEKHWLIGCRGGRGTKANLQGGAGFLLTRHAAMMIAAHCTKLEGAEDRQARYSMQQAGVRFRHCSYFYYRPSVVPLPDNKQITTHRVRVRAWRGIHDQFEQAGLNDTKTLLSGKFSK